MLRYEFFLALAMYFGHGALWTYLFNALHAFPIPCRYIKVMERIVAPIAALPLLAMPFWASWYESADGHPAFLIYRNVCWFIAAIAPLLWAHRRLHRDSAHGLLEDRVQTQRVAGPDNETLITGRWRWLNLFGNQSETLEVHRKRLALPDLPAAWEGFAIAHLSDLHLTGRLTLPFYEEVTRQTLALNPDLIVITGDIIESEDCLPWLDATLGKLSAPCGVYFILGNHDKRMADPEDLRRRLVDLGLSDVGGQVVRRGTPRGELLLAGNETPWFGPAPEVEAGSHSDGALPIALLHTPDRFGWAADREFPLALAGHTHGGQVRFPIIGPMICPSRYGNRYASGVFRRNRSVMHVSRGLAALHPIRIRCAPELALLTLETAKQ